DLFLTCQTTREQEDPFGFPLRRLRVGAENDNRLFPLAERLQGTGAQLDRAVGAVPRLVGLLGLFEKVDDALGVLRLAAAQQRHRVVGEVNRVVGVDGGQVAELFAGLVPPGRSWSAVVV